VQGPRLLPGLRQLCIAERAAHLVDHVLPPDVPVRSDRIDVAEPNHRQQASRD